MIKSRGENVDHGRRPVRLRTLTQAFQNASAATANRDKVNTTRVELRQFRVRRKLRIEVKPFGILPVRSFQ
ncbi:MAG: hypothetical protein CMJ64_28975 [Planctomycetaceae bacterium]|nr:hypothetical protein [Planctomycetaceae bacterium]